uniref:Ig-like domain-containing protein n=1 Tax=Chelonoidis abingdonii TaxID=106734 RepID=A0A8C0JDX8_CHEAB
MRLSCSKVSFVRWETVTLSHSPNGKGLVGAALRHGCPFSASSKARDGPGRRNSGKWRLPSPRLPAPSCCLPQLPSAAPPILFPLFDGFSYILFIFSATPTPPSVFPLVPCCTKTGNAPPDTSLACLVTGYFPSPVEIKWNSGKVTKGVTTFPEVTMSNGRFTQSSLLIIPARSRQGDTNQCDVTHQGTATTLSKTFPQEGKTRGRGGRDSQSELFKAPRESGISSAAKTEPPKKNSNGTTSLVSSHPVSLAQWGQGTQFTCKVTTPCSVELTQDITMGNTAKAPSVSLLLPSPVRPSPNAEVWLPCEVSGFFPSELLIEWKRDNHSIESSGYITLLPVAEERNSQSCLKNPVSQWESGVVYTCMVGCYFLPVNFRGQDGLSGRALHLLGNGL